MVVRCWMSAIFLGEVAVPSPPDYFLKTPRLGFRLWTNAALPLAIALWGDPQATRLIGGPFSDTHIQDRVAREIVTMQAHRVQFWPVFLLDGGDFIGCCGFRPRKLEERIFELGYAFLPRYWGKGFATESARAAISHAADSLKARGLFAGHHPENLPSQKILESLGFRYTHRELYPPTGEMHPCYSLTLNSPPASVPPAG
jgi:[ribosomal protein S5]-alanine N-acetyltransferase